MRGFDRDLIRGGHYGQRSCEPHKQAEHMAAPTKPAGVKKVLANPEPSTHGTERHSPLRSDSVALGCEADMRTVDRSNQSDVNDPIRTSVEGRIVLPPNWGMDC